MALNKNTPREFNRDGEGRASFPLMGHLREPKAERGLFDGEELIKRDEEISRIRALNNNIVYSYAGQKIEGLTPSQSRLLLILSNYVTTLRDSAGNIPQDVKNLIEWTEKKAKFGAEFTEPAPANITRPVLLKDLAKTMYGRSTKRDIKKLREELYFLHNTEHTIETPKYTINSHIIMINTSIVDKRDIEEELQADAMILIFSPVLLWNINRNYIGLNNKIFETLRKAGNNTFLLSRLLADILLVRGSHIKKAIEVRKAGKKSGENPEETENKVKEMLLYKRPADTIAEKTGTDYTSQRQYRAKFRSDFNKALKALKEMEIITGGFLELPNKRGSKSLGEIKLFLNEGYNTKEDLLEEL